MSLNDSQNISSETYELPEIFVKLNDGFSVQTKIAWKFWIALAIVSALAIISSYGTGDVTIPFIGEVKRTDFFPFATILISILLIGYSSAQIQAIRTRRLLQKIIDNTKEEVILPGDVHLQDVFDGITSPAVNRVAPLAQILQGKHQFLPDSDNCPVILVFLSIAYYIILKLITYLVMYAFPALALARSILLGNIFTGDVCPWNVPLFVFKTVSVIALIIALQLLVIDVLYTIRAIRKRIAARFAKKK